MQQNYNNDGGCRIIVARIYGDFSQKAIPTKNVQCDGVLADMNVQMEIVELVMGLEGSTKLGSKPRSM